MFCSTACDPDWTVDVDGAAVPLMRANAALPGRPPDRGRARRHVQLPPASALSGRRDYGTVRRWGWPSRWRGVRGVRRMREVGRAAGRSSCSRCRSFPSSACSPPARSSSSATCRSSSGRATCGCGTRSPAGEAPWWDPHVAGGQSAIADALNQLADAGDAWPSGCCRPPVVAFNLWVALPLPLAALGHVRVPAPASRPAGGRGAGSVRAFALSGPIVSMLNLCPTSAWSVAFMPWVLFACDRLLERASAATFTTLAVVSRADVCGEAGDLAVDRRPGCRVCHLPGLSAVEGRLKAEATGSGTAEATGSGSAEAAGSRSAEATDRRSLVDWRSLVASAFGGR